MTDLAATGGFDWTLAWRVILVLGAMGFGGVAWYLLAAENHELRQRVILLEVAMRARPRTALALDDEPATEPIPAITDKTVEHPAVDLAGGLPRVSLTKGRPWTTQAPPVAPEKPWIEASLRGGRFSYDTNGRRETKASEIPERRKASGE